MLLKLLTIVAGVLLISAAQNTGTSTYDIALRHCATVGASIGCGAIARQRSAEA